MLEHCVDTMGKACGAHLPEHSFLVHLVCKFEVLASLGGPSPSNPKQSMTITNVIIIQVRKYVSWVGQHVGLRIIVASAQRSQHVRAYIAHPRLQVFCLLVHRLFCDKKAAAFLKKSDLFVFTFAVWKVVIQPVHSSAPGT